MIETSLFKNINLGNFDEQFRGFYLNNFKMFVFGSCDFYLRLFTRAAFGIK